MSTLEVLNYRGAIERKLESKKCELGETEESLKKFVGHHRTNLFRNRLGPLVGNGGDDSQGRPLSNRLGPKIDSAQNGSGERKSVLSRVIVEQKSRDDALAEQKPNQRETMRNKRMFGSIMGTLQGFVRDENREKDRERRKREIEKKIDLRAELEKEEAVKQKQDLFEDKRRKQREIKALQLQMVRVEEFEIWEKSKRFEQRFIRTKKTTPGRAVYFLPKEHNQETLKALKETQDGLEEEIGAAREAFEQELLKINARVENPSLNLEDFDESQNEEDDDDDLKNLSVVSAVQRPEADRGKEPPPVRNQSSLASRNARSTSRSVVAKNDQKRSQPEAKRTAPKCNDVQVKQEKQPPTKRPKKESSDDDDESSSSSSSSDDSSSSSSDSSSSDSSASSVGGHEKRKFQSSKKR